MSRDSRIFLQDILESCRKILSYTERHDFGAFVADQLVFDAVVRNLEIVGEAARHLTENVTNQIDVDWPKVRGFRNRLIHEYFGIDEVLVWEVVSSKVPEPLTKVETYLSE